MNLNRSSRGVVLVLLAFACSPDGSSPTLPPEKRETIDPPVNECDEGCVYEIYGEDHLAPVGSGTITPSGPYFCPVVWPQAHFVWKGHHFSTEGNVQYVQALPAWNGIPRGRYRLMSGPYQSDDNNAVIWSGTLNGSCHVRKIGPFIAGFMIWTVATIDAQEFGSGGGGTLFAGISSMGGGFPHDAPGSESAHSAFFAYLDDGICTAGWVIEIDGVRVC